MERNRPQQPSVNDTSSPTVVARHMIEAVTYLISVANHASLPRLALLLNRVRQELFIIQRSEAVKKQAVDGRHR